MLGLNLSRDIDYPKVFRGFISPSCQIPGKRLDQATAVFFRFLTNSAFI
jgi:hypothetical protein